MERKKQNQDQGRHSDPETVAEILTSMASHNENSNQEYPYPIPDGYVDLIGQWKKNISLCVDLTTHLHADPLPRMCKCYAGTLRRDGYDQYSFMEASTPATPARNPYVFRGQYINVTRSCQGEYRPNFRPMPKVANATDLKHYAWGVFRELRLAFEGVLPKAENHELLETQGEE